MADVSASNTMDEKIKNKRYDRPDYQFGWIRRQFPIYASKYYDAGIFAFEASSRCMEWERDYYRCASKCTRKNANAICWKELEDYMECMKMKKQIMRRVRMDRERKQFNMDKSDPLPQHLNDPGFLKDPTDPGVQ